MIIVIRADKTVLVSLDFAHLDFLRSRLSAVALAAISIQVLKSDMYDVRT